MARAIDLKKSDFKILIDEFIDYLKSGKIKYGDVTFNRSVETNDRATLTVSDLAYNKMLALVDEYSTEVGWHATVSRVGVSNFEIQDVYVYPQVVTGATVTTDQEEYQKWLMNFNDELFEKMKMHGHSHVNMGTSPSSVDINFYNSIKEQIGNDGFYIFVILNKKRDYYIEIYDFKNNIIYGKSDIDIVLPQSIVESFNLVKESKSMVKAKSFTKKTEGKQVKYKKPATKSSEKEAEVYPFDGYFRGSDYGDIW